ncbi:MAG TPA: TolC family protein [Gemmatimonadales bacterium]|nr:TolC family protein [Gemmatimonadales bacterium]
MTTSRTFALILTMLAAAPAAFAQQPVSSDTTSMLRAQLANVRRVTLREALEDARQNAPAMVQAQQNIRLSDMSRMQAWAAYLPSISGSGSSSKSSSQRVNQFGTVTAGAPQNSSSFGLSASLNLFTGFQRGANSRLASATSAENEAALIAQQYATDLATKQAFFTELADEELVTVAQTQVRRSQEQLKLTSEKLRLGATTRADSLSAQVDYGTQQLAFIQAQANALTARANLARAIGFVGTIAAVPDTMLEVRITSLDTAALRRDALANAPSVVEAVQAVEAARASLSASRSSIMPTLSASASQRWAGSVLFPWNTVAAGSTGPKYTGTWSLGLTLSYPIFNNFQREASIVQADANVVSSQAKLRDARLALDANLTQALAALDAASQQIDVSRTQVAAAQENLRMQRERYRLGASTIVDMLTAEVSTNQAEVALVQARYNYLIARAQLEAYVGHAL